MSPSLVMLWLAALPCDHAPREVEQLTQLSGQEPELLDAYLQEVEARWEGLALRSPGDDTPSRKVETAVHRLQTACALIEEARATPAKPVHTNPARLQDILSRPEFALARQRQGDVLQRLLLLVKDWLAALLETRQAQSFATSTRTGVLVLGFAVALFAALRLRHWRRGPRRPQDGSPASAVAPRLDSPGEHLARARTALGTQPREAIRQGLLALLSSLEARRLARPDRVRTNRELVDELPGRGAPERLTQEVERLVRWYDRAFYSLAPVGAEDAARFVAEVERFHQGLEAPAS